MMFYKLRKHFLLNVFYGLIFSAASFNSFADSIYYQRDEQGTPSFSDNNLKSDAKKIIIEEANTLTLPTPEKKPATEYYELNLQQTSANPFRFQASSKPFLKSGHRFVWMLDGQLKKKGVSRLLTVRHASAGSHTVQISIVDKDNKTLISTDRLFTVERKKDATAETGQAKVKERSPCKGMPTKAGKQALWQQYQYQQYDKKPKTALEAARWELDKQINREQHQQIQTRPCEYKANEYINKP